MLTKQERLATAYSDLTKVNAAIDQLLQGKSLTKLEFRSTEVQQMYEYTSVSLTELKLIRKELLELIDSLEEVSQISYRSSSSVPLIISRRF